MNDNPTDLEQAMGEHRSLLARLGLSALVELLTGQHPGAMLHAEPLAALVTLIADSGEQP